MKAPPFDYARPASLDAVFDLLAVHGDAARLLAGGQTLLATLNMRLSEPALLIDLGGLDALKGIAVHGPVLRIGALATHTEIEASEVVARHAPLFALAAPHIAHRAIRNRGTLGGSIAYADPAAEWPACLVAVGGAVVVRGRAGERRIAAADFFTDLFTTALGAGELIVACELPLHAPGSGVVWFDELARRQGDYASCGLALAAHRSGTRLHGVRLAFLGIGVTPVRAPRAEAAVDSRALDAASIDAAVATLKAELTAELNPLADLTNSSAMKRHLAGVLLRRALHHLLAAGDALPRAA